MLFATASLSWQGSAAECQSQDQCPSLEPWRPAFSPESYVDREGIWIRRPIPVCWEDFSTRYGRERRIVERAVAEVIEDVSPVEFSGGSRGSRWPKCEVGSLGIRIRVENLRPESDVGQQWRRNSEGAPEVELPTRMRLNFVLDGAFQSTCSGRREECIKVVAVHEFLHAIGFLHEQLRCDAPAECRERFSHQSDFQGFRPTRISEAYDPESMTNYCNSIYRRDVRLSNYDIEAIRYFYAEQ